MYISVFFFKDGNFYTSEYTVQHAKKKTWRCKILRTNPEAPPQKKTNNATSTYSTQCGGETSKKQELAADRGATGSRVWNGFYYAI